MRNHVWVSLWVPISGCHVCAQGEGGGTGHANAGGTRRWSAVAQQEQDEACVLNKDQN